ncbi:glycosyltransferase family 87 protein [Corynebacterium sp. HS2168-gen11]|uniref:glycosyltransferase family 87 protein n=1 Tax=Corynebacterium sp. HS2168-gen11 TaxID=2974027 RepID=UPI00216B1C42|nr:glycosyltransferase family 87 protein [Corynebacterium sp. HS2168-gen11]MCS4535213.1 DUF2029 domain-containing protein [Corynebacterium sp. HS2168-gen11]
MTDDYSTVYLALRRFWDGVPVYNEHYSFVDPHYLYNPGATLLLSPLALVENFAIARMVFICVNATAIILALILLLRQTNWPRKAWILPLAISLAFVTEAVQNTLIFSNINGILLLLLVVFLISEQQNAQLRSGLSIGLAIVIKPIFLPLLFLPAVRIRIISVGVALAVPTVLNVLAWSIVPEASEYLSRTVPYLSIVRDYANASLPGMTTYFQIYPLIARAVWLTFAVLIAFGILALLRIRVTDSWNWLILSTSLILSGVFLLSSLGQMYYSLFLLPLFFTLAAARSPFTFISLWIGLLLCLNPLRFQLSFNPVLGEWLTTFQATLGWALIVTTLATDAILRARSTTNTPQPH